MDRIILIFIGFFFVLGGIDYIFGNPLRLGIKFEEGIKTMGALGLGMIGIYSLAPVISRILNVGIIPVSKFFHFDPSIFPGVFLALDMGGYQMAMDLALIKEMGLFSGVILASTLGATISFTIPVALGIISKEDEKYFFKGVMVGITTIPIGCLVGGLWQGIEYHILLWNLIPTFGIAIILIFGILVVPNILIKGLNIFGKIIMAISIFGLLLQGINAIFGFQLILGVVPLSEATMIVGKIAFVLAGAYPMIEIVNRLFKDSIERIGNKMGINSVSVTAILGSLANNLLIFGTYHKMNPKGKMICTAFGISGAFVFGGQFGFVSGIAPEMIGAFIISKFTAGILSIILAVWLYDIELNKNIKRSKRLSYEN